MNQIIEDSKKQLFIVICIAFAAFIATLDMYIVNIALPDIVGSFHIGTSKASWVSLSYFLSVSATLLLFGRAVDKIGIKKIFGGGYFVFTLGSFLCGMSPNFIFLVLARALQGIGMSMLSVSVFSAVPKYLPVNKRGWAFGLLSTTADPWTFGTFSFQRNSAPSSSCLA